MIVTRTLLQLPDIALEQKSVREHRTTQLNTTK